MPTRTARRVNSSATWATQSKAAKIASALKMGGVANSPSVLKCAADKWNMFTMARRSVRTRISSARSVQTNATQAFNWLDPVLGPVFT